MERIGAVLRSDKDLEAVLRALLDEMLALFACDRAWLLTPCDPTAPSWRVPMERTRRQWPGAFVLGVEVPMDPETAALMADALAADAPLAFDSRSGRSLPTEVAKAFHIRSQLIMALRPRVGPAWLLGIHHCGRDHVFTPEELHIFEGVCRRVADALGSLLLLQDLTRSEARFRTLVEHAPEAIVVMDAAGRFVDANGKAADLLGVSHDDLLHSSLRDHCPTTQPGGHDTDSLLRGQLADAAAGFSPRFELVMRHTTGRELPTEVRLIHLDHGAEPRVRGSILDLSEQRSLKLQVQHLQKMEALGELAGSVAHDLNNQLVVILCYAEMLGEASSPAQSASLVHRVVRAASDASSLTSQLLAFSRRSSLQPAVVDLDDLITSSASLLERVLGAGVTLELALSGTPTPAFVDLQQVEQVLVNLVTNARDALPEGGKVRVSSAVHELSPDTAGPLGLSPGRYASFSVQDDGIGMDVDTLDRLFEPFFTTKERGKGTGLGLSTARAAVEQSGGVIEVHSEVGQGSTFTVYLPVAGSDRVIATESGEPAKEPGGSERVLVVEAHSLVGRIATDVLEAGGYQVKLVGNATAAQAAVTTGQPFDLLITKVMLGADDGVALAASLRRLQPSLRVLFTTSFSAQALARFTHSPERVVLLQKPWSPDGLLARVRRVLDGDMVGAEE